MLLYQRVECVNMAVADAPGTIAFSSTNDTTNHAVAATEQCDGVIEVKVTTLDLVASRSAPTLIKIDVEGYETLVLRGGAMMLASPSLLAVIMEVNGSGKRYGFDDAKLFAMMRELGFAPCTYEPFSRRLSSIPAGNENVGNILFVRDKEAVECRLKAAEFVRLRGLQF